MRLRRPLVMVLLLAAWPIAAAITGTVVLSDGTPVGNARVMALRPAATTDLEAALSAEPEKPLATAVTDAKGAFTIAVEGRGLIRLHMDVDGFAPLDAIVERDEPAGRLRLRAAPVVEGHVRVDGKPTAGGRSTVIDRIAPGSYTLEVTPAGGKPRKYAVTVVQGVTTPVTID
jgi:hypothetical protein